MHCHLVEIERRGGPLGLGLAWSVLQDLTKKLRPWPVQFYYIYELEVYFAPEMHFKQIFRSTHD